MLETDGKEQLSGQREEERVRGTQCGPGPKGQDVEDRCLSLCLHTPSLSQLSKVPASRTAVGVP